MDLYSKLLSKGFTPHIIKLTNKEIRINKILSFFGIDPKYKEKEASSVLVIGDHKVFFDDLGYVDYYDPNGVEHQFGKRFDDNILLNLVDKEIKMLDRSEKITKVLSHIK